MVVGSPRASPLSKGPRVGCQTDPAVPAKPWKRYSFEAGVVCGERVRRRFKEVFEFFAHDEELAKAIVNTDLNNAGMPNMYLFLPSASAASRPGGGGEVRHYSWTCGRSDWNWIDAES